MRLKDNWWPIVCRAWSIRFILLAGLLSGLEVFLPLIDGFWAIPQGCFAAASGIVTGLAFVARLLTQNNLAG